jgi:tetratricopeptide (TPR) repeat protein
MSDWYRRTDWNDEIAADFEVRLARARPATRAQYLSVQGYALLKAHPDQAELILERAITAGNPAELPRAACYLALARVAGGNIDGAIMAYELAIAVERQNSAFRSTAGVDQALLIALHDRADLFRQALDQLAMAAADDWSLAGLEALVAESVIRHKQGEGERARKLARQALQLFPDEAEGAEWAGISFDGLRARLEAIANG